MDNKKLKDWSKGKRKKWKWNNKDKAELLRSSSKPKRNFCKQYLADFLSNPTSNIARPQHHTLRVPTPRVAHLIYLLVPTLRVIIHRVALLNPPCKVLPTTSFKTQIVTPNPKKYVLGSPTKKYVPPGPKRHARTNPKPNVRKSAKILGFVQIAIKKKPNRDLRHRLRGELLRNLL